METEWDSFIMKKTIMNSDLLNNSYDRCIVLWIILLNGLQNVKHLFLSHFKSLYTIPLFFCFPMNSVSIIRFLLSEASSKRRWSSTGNPFSYAETHSFSNYHIWIVLRWQSLFKLLRKGTVKDRLGESFLFWFIA